MHASFAFDLNSHYCYPRKLRMIFIHKHPIATHNHRSLFFLQTALGKYLYDQLALVGGLTLYGPSTSEATRTGLVAFNCDTVHATDLSFFLDQEGVAVRTGKSAQ